MEQPTQFRSAFNGFNREDVVRYMEYIHNKHSAQVAQLSNELASLRDRPEAPQTELEEQICRLTEENQTLRQQIAQLEDKLRQAGEAPSSSQELEAYRRAERVERTAKERARRIVKDTSALLESASVKVSGAADQLSAVAAQLSAQMELIQQAAAEGSQAFVEAASAVEQLNADLED